jgi:hypothetical protein
VDGQFNLHINRNYANHLVCLTSHEVGKGIQTKDFDILIQKSEQDAHVTEFILSDDCSTCFGYHYHPSSGAQITGTTASGNRYTVIDRVKLLLLKSTYRLD